MKFIQKKSKLLVNICSQDTLKFEDSYLMKEKIGEGMHSQVFKCFKEED